MNPRDVLLVLLGAQASLLTVWLLATIDTWHRQRVRDASRTTHPAPKETR